VKGRISRYARLLGVQVRASAVTSMQYRVDFLIEGAMSFYWLGWNLVPLLILYNQRDTVAGWDFPSALVVIAWFTVLRGFLEGAINPSLIGVVEKIRTGEFDYLLLKPADAQFLVSTAKFEPWKVIDILGGFGLAVAAFVMLGRTPGPGNVALCLLLLLAAALVLYSIWILIISASFWVIRLDNLVYLFMAVFDAARWPIAVFRGFWRVLFTLIIPLALMTTFPAMAILGTLEARTAVFGLGGALLFAGVARALWRAAIRSYTSASS
jgi:ABC-2 type transport system permease protein